MGIGRSGCEHLCQTRDVGSHLSSGIEQLQSHGIAVALWRLGSSHLVAHLYHACVRQVLGIGTESMLSCERTSNRAREIDLTRWVGHGGASSTEQIGCRRLHAVVVLELLDDVAHTIDGFLACSLLGPPCVRDWVTGCLSNWRTHVPARWLASVGRASDRQLRVRRLLRPFGGSIVHWSSSARCTMPRRLYAMHHNESIVSRPNECTSLRA